MAIRDMLNEVIADCEKDATDPLVPTIDVTVEQLRRAVAERRGEMLAMIQALAKGMLKVLDEIERTALEHEQAKHPM